MSPSPNHFECLGLPVQVDLDRERFEQSYFDLARQWHPDRFVGKSEQAQAQAQLQAAQLNEAYRVLRDPVRRAEYLIKLGGIDLDSSDPVHGAPSPSQAFLMEMLELRDAIEEGEIDSEEALDDAQDRMDSALRQGLQALREQELQVAANFLVEHRYFQRLVQELEGS